MILFRTDLIPRGKFADTVLAIARERNLRRQHGVADCVSVRRLVIAALIGVGVSAAILPVVVAENALHIWVRPVADPGAAAALAQATGSEWEAARITADDGILLDGWLFTPQFANGSAVILMHGVGDTRLGMLGHARYLLLAGFTVLTPDCRGHGTSGGAIISYGVKEASDVHRWADWLLRRQAVRRLYGLGESMGSAILLESLTQEPRFRAIVAECPFSSFEDVACYRLQEASGLGHWAAWPVARAGFLYARIRYGVDLSKASPAAAVRASHVPVLLIHGTSDRNIPFAESEMIHALNPAVTRLWLVEGARHVSALAARPAEYVSNVVDWFRSHP